MSTAHLYNINASTSGLVAGLYAITPDEIDTKILCAKVGVALQGGLRLVQYRNKAADATLRLQQATALLALCRSYQVPLIINDDLDLCARIKADGLHLGVTDCDLAAARRLLGPDKIIGASCYNQLDLAVKAEQAGASYVAFGACFTSNTKPDAVHAPISLFIKAKQQLTLPLVAIGGINLANAAQVLAAGADCIAVSEALFKAQDISQISRQFASLF